jgi:hypothetical protein
LPRSTRTFVAVAGLLDDAGDDLADAVDVLVVHHLALGLADPLQDHLLRRLRGDAAEVVRRHVLARDLVLGNLGPVDLEVVVGEQRVVLLARLLLDPLELLECALARLVEQALLEVGGQLDREHAEVPVLVELDRRMPRGAGRLLVRREERILQRRDERALLDSLLTLDLANGFNDLLAHLPLPFVDQVRPHDLVVRDLDGLTRHVRQLQRALARGHDLAARPQARGLQPHPAPERALEVLARAERPVEAWRRHLDAVAVEVAPQEVRHALAELVVDSPADGRRRRGSAPCP